MAKKPKAPVINAATVKNLRAKLKLNQSAFWSKLGVTQSGGSRYEAGRDIPTPVKRLFHIVYAGGSHTDAAYPSIK